MRRERFARREVVACVVAALLASVSVGCDDKKKGSAGTSDASASASANPTKASVSALPGCHPGTPGGSLVRVPPGALSLAVARGKALVVGTTERGPNAPSTASPGRAGAARVVLGASGTPESEPEPIHDALAAADDVATFAAAVALGGELTTLSYAVRRPSPTACVDGVLAAKASAGDGQRRELLANVCRPTTMFRGAARANLGIALSDGPSPGVVDAWLLDAGKARLAPLEALTGASPRDAGPRDAGDGGHASVDAPAVAAGAASVAAAYVVVRGATRELHVARLAPGPTAEPARVAVFDKQNVGTVTTAFEDDTLHVVWSSFVPDKNRYVLRWSKWPAGGSPSAPQSIGTGVLSAVAPSLAIDHGRFLLAWTEGDGKVTTVKVGASKNGLAFIAGLAGVVSSPGVPAREPVVALEADTMFVAWKELGAETEARASPITCRE